MIAIVTARGDADPTSRVLFEAAAQRCGGRYLDPGELAIDLRRGYHLTAGGHAIEEFDAFILRGFNRAADIDFQFEVFELIEGMGIPVLNSCRSLSIAESKPSTLYLLGKAGLPVPRTVACQTEEVAYEVLREFGDAVSKPLYGALGEGVEHVLWPDAEGRLRDGLEHWRSICIQEYVPTGGRDIRAFVVGDSVVGAVLRIAQGDEWRTNVHQGGHCEAYPLDDRESEICRRAASLVGLEYTGIDILPGPDGPILLEVNGAPQWHGLATATGIDVAGAVVERALELSRRRGQAPM